MKNSLTTSLTRFFLTALPNFFGVMMLILGRDISLPSLTSESPRIFIIKRDIQKEQHNVIEISRSQNSYVSAVYEGIYALTFLVPQTDLNSTDKRLQVHQDILTRKPQFDG